MLYPAFQPIKAANQSLAVTSTAQTSQQLGWVQGNADSSLFLVQPLNNDIYVTLDGETDPVVGSVGFLLQGKIPAIFTAGEMVTARWITASTSTVNVQGGQPPMRARPLY